MADNTDTRLTFECRMAYAHLDKPHSAADGATEKYSVTALVEKTAAVVKQIQECTKAAKAAKWGAKPPSGLRSCVRDGDEKDEEGNYIRRGDEFRGHYYIGCSSTRPVPVVIGKSRLPATPDQMISGYYAAVSVNFAGYDAAGNKGVAAYLNAVWITRRGERLGGADPEAAFSEMKDVAVDDFTAATGFAGDPFAAAGAAKGAAQMDDSEF